MRWYAAGNCGPRSSADGVIWRVREDDLLAYIAAAYEKTAQRIAAGQIPEETSTED
ncbi:hypothetical protein [Arthrobacter sp. H-02-3]|uniref:hypothetical protein n=1 Tax=Arthrobacter sp. H-02-3 TaxID=2703675 RepID=UPI003FA481BA